MKIIIATDGTAESVHALSMSEIIRFSDNDEILVVSVVDMALPVSFESFSYVPDTAELEKSARENAKIILEQTATKFREKLGEVNADVSTEVLFGSPEVRIVEKAEEIGADLIIVGSHGYSRWERLLLGSVSNSVVHHAPCSVFVVRSRKE